MVHSSAFFQLHLLYLCPHQHRPCSLVPISALGYSLSFLVGTNVAETLSWRWAFAVVGLAGLPLAGLLLLCVREPHRESGAATPLFAAPVSTSTSGSVQDVPGVSNIVNKDSKPDSKPGSKPVDKIAKHGLHNSGRMAVLVSTMAQLMRICRTRYFALLCLAAALRNAGGYAWAISSELFFENTKGLSPTTIR